MEAIPNYTILNLFVISEEVYCFDHEGTALARGAVSERIVSGGGPHPFT
jgi:hypothetical protein